MDLDRKRAVLEKFPELRFKADATLELAEEMAQELEYVLEVERHVETQVALARAAAGDINEREDALLRVAIETAFVAGWTRAVMDRAELAAEGKQ